MRQRILFFAEAVSLAHVARPSMLAAAAEAAGAEVHFASNGQYAICHASKTWQLHPIDSVSPPEFLRRLATGSPVYRKEEIERFVVRDLELIRTVKPDLVVGDFRLSLAVSARLTGVPLLSLCNAYWSPYARDQRPPPAPDLPIGRLLGQRLFGPIFRAAWPLANRLHVAPMNAVRRRHGLGPYATLREMYCDGDRVMYADLPSMSPVAGAPPSHSYLGPIVWSPAIAKPAWWTEAQAGAGPKAYVTLGSTGSTELLPHIAAACRAAGVRCIVATAGRATELTADPPWIYTADFLAGSDAAEMADLVICNGGSPTSHQALAAGRPVLGICSNIDQLLNMRQVAAAGAGVSMRPIDAGATQIAAAISRLLGPTQRGASQALQREFAAFDTSASFVHLLSTARNPAP